jgi:hypothetical protein
MILSRQDRFCIGSPSLYSYPFLKGLLHEMKVFKIKSLPIVVKNCCCLVMEKIKDKSFGLHILKFLPIALFKLRVTTFRKPPVIL